MKVIDQNNAAAALEKDLVPGPSLIDGRTEKERLNFLCRFGALLNFYDKNNQLNGNWQPFLLKDPVFLLAYISHTGYTKEHRLFVQTCKNLQDAIKEQNTTGVNPTEAADEMVALFNQLFDQLTRVFMNVEQWTFYMQLGGEEYDLKKYVIDQVKYTYNSYLWAILSLRDFLASSSALTDQSVNEILPVRQYVLDAFTDDLWTKGTGTVPFLQLLGIYSIDKVEKTNISSQGGGPVPAGITPTPKDYFDGLKNAGEQLFMFYRTVIDHAGPQYETEKIKKSSYPDTLLLRTFSNLLEVHQQQLNEIANKHLHFYYSDILKQSEQPAVADSVFITTVLGKNISVFDLPAGTLFNAGTDAQKNPIWFSSNEDVSLNAAQIAGVYTLADYTQRGSKQSAGGSLDETFKAALPSGQASVNGIATQSNGQVIVAGIFGGQSSANIIRLNADGSADSSFNTNTQTITLNVETLLLQSNGNCLAAGWVNGENSSSSPCVIRLLPTGDPDQSFNINEPTLAYVYALAVQADGKIIVGGSTIASAQQFYLSRRNADGSEDTAFTKGVGDPKAASYISTIAIQADGKIIVGGQFSTYNGTTVNNLVRLNTDGSVDTDFINSGSGANSSVAVCVIQPDEKILIGGQFSQYNGQSIYGIVRIDTTGAIDPGFEPVTLNAGNSINSICIQDDGKIIIGGVFTLSDGSQNIARLNPDGSEDETFYSGNGADKPVSALALQSDGQIIFGGETITSFCGVTINSIARLNKERELPELYLQTISAPTTVSANEAGQALTWEAFGGTTNQDSSAAPIKQMGFAFGSPMLFLQEGTREVMISFVFEQLPDSIIFNNADIFLSTSTAWLPVTAEILPTESQSPGTLRMKIVLDATQPAIGPFATTPTNANPDGFTCVWPMFKVTFDYFSSLAVPPVLTSIGIDVCVTGVTTLALYNDNGLLNAKKPFQPFGPIVNMNSNFIVGSNEIFSKPLKWLAMDLDWGQLPPASTTPTLQTTEFGIYYTGYNSILFSGVQVTPLARQEQSTEQISSAVKTAAPANLAATETKTSGKASSSPGKLKTFFKNAWKVISWPVRFPVQKLVQLFSKKKSTLPASSRAETGEKPAPVQETKSGTSPRVLLGPPKTGQSVPFSNICFTVEFSMLEYNEWNSIHMYNYSDSPQYAAWLKNPDNQSTISRSGTANNFQLFDTSSANYVLGTSSLFGYFASDNAAPVADPAIQNSPLVYTGANEAGFIKMTLVNPANGFGNSVYSNVVTGIATLNAVNMMNAAAAGSSLDPSDITAAANVPFIPTVQAITAGYGASQTYDLTKASESYPLQYFYYTPFANYTAYDNSPEVEVNYSVDISMIGDMGTISGLQMVPSFTSNSVTDTGPFPCSGAMYIGFTGLVPLNPISLFFELSTTYSAPTEGAEINYYYLGKNGWTPLSLLNDGTNQFTCSGIITVNIPADIVNDAACMPGNNYWIAIGASIDPAQGVTLNLSSFAQVILLAPNGVELTRWGTTYLTDTTAPVIPAGTISKPQNPIPEIGTIAQPFESFGGRAAENKPQMYTRVSRRLKTKDRATSGNDIFTTISQQFPDIYFSGAVFNPDKDHTTVYVVEGFDSYTDANAFRPFVSECEMEAILKFLKKRVSLFANIAVSNYKFQSVTVSATVTVKQGYVPQAMSASIAQALDIFLSPWIGNTTQEQVPIGQPITASQVAAFIRNIQGVESVSGVELSVSSGTPSADKQTLKPEPGELFVSSLAHNINASLAST